MILGQAVLLRFRLINELLLSTATAAAAAGAFCSAMPTTARAVLSRTNWPLSSTATTTAAEALALINIHQ